MHKMPRFSLTNLSIIIILFSVFKSQAQNDTEFWFAAPDNVHAPSSGNIRDEPLKFRFTSFDQNANITISQPANPTFTPINLTVTANNTITQNMTNLKSIIECQPANNIVNYGLLIQSSSPITAYFENTSPSNPDIYTLKGRNAIGRSFIVPSQLDFAQEYSSSVPNSFYVIATKDNTQVQIIPKKAIVGHNAGQQFTITLNAGQVYVATAIDRNAANHLGGSQVSANKDIAVVVNDDSADPYAPDLMGDQTIPNNRLGENYIVVQGNIGEGSSTTRDRVYIFGSENNTMVYRDGNLAPVANIHKGTSYSFEFLESEESTFIESNKPILVYHMSGFNGQPGAAVLPPIECTGSDIIAFTRSEADDFYLMVITEAGNEDDFILRGSTNLLKASDFHNVPGTGGDWKAAKKQYTTGQIPVGVASVIENTSGLFHLGIINGETQRYCRYGFFSNFASLNLGPDIDYCKGDTVTLDAGSDMDTYRWYDNDAPTTVISTEQSIDIWDTGTYFCVVTYEMCMPSDTIHLGWRADPTPDLGADTAACREDVVTFSPGSYNSYLWFDGSTNATYDSPTSETIWVKVWDAYGCRNSDTVVRTTLAYPPPTMIYHD